MEKTLPPTPRQKKRQNISTRTFLEWDRYRDKTPEESLNSIYAHITATCKELTGWYWTSIKRKKIGALVVRWAAFLLLVTGSSLQIFATTLDVPLDRLFYTQLAVISFAIAALVLVGDRAFGWSSGWTRYITTVTTMENLARAFQIEWAGYLLQKTSALEAEDTKKLFDLARGLEQELLKLQADETTAWVTEFNAGMALLESTIKTQREETEKKVAAIRTTLEKQESAAASDEKAKVPGSVEVSLDHKGPARKVRITFGSDAPVQFLGTSWTKVEVAPGHYALKIETGTEPIQTIEKIVEVKPASIARIDIKLDS
jgi:hypothetical protein